MLDAITVRWTAGWMRECLEELIHLLTVCHITVESQETLYTLRCIIIQMCQ
jgi:hypothetical protein